MAKRYVTLSTLDALQVIGSLTISGLSDKFLRWEWDSLHPHKNTKEKRSKWKKRRENAKKRASMTFYLEENCNIEAAAASRERKMQARARTHFSRGP